MPSYGQLKGSAPRTFGSPDQPRDADGKFSSGGGTTTTVPLRPGERLTDSYGRNRGKAKAGMHVDRVSGKLTKPGVADEYGRDQARAASLRSGKTAPGAIRKTADWLVSGGMDARDIYGMAGRNRRNRDILVSHLGIDPDD